MPENREQKVAKLVFWVASSRKNLKEFSQGRPADVWPGVV